MADKDALEQWSYYCDRSVDLRPFGNALASEVVKLRKEIERMKKAERDRRYRDEGYGGHL